jgi:hypothetical protein
MSWVDAFLGKDNYLWIKAADALYHAYMKATVYSTKDWLAEGVEPPLCHTDMKGQLGILWLGKGAPEGRESFKCELCCREIILRDLAK